MRFVLLAMALTAPLATAACIERPKTATVQPDERPTLAIIGAPQGSILYVDGREMGPAPVFDGVERTLSIENGAHLVEIRAGGRSIHSQRIFVEGATRKVIEVGTVPAS